MKVSLDPHVNQTDRDLGRAYADFSENLTHCKMFRIVATAGITAGLSEAEATFKKQFQEIFGSISLNNEQMMFIKARAHNMARDSARRSAEFAIRDASLVFSHAILERLIHDLMRIIGTACPECVVNRVKNKTVTIAASLKSDKAQLIKKAVDSYICELIRESLKKKLQFLISVCSFQPSCQRHGYKYDQNRLESIDKERQEILHKHPFKTSPKPCSEDLDFIEGTGLFFINMVALKLNASVDLWEATVALSAEENHTYM